MKLQLRFFASLREGLGLSEETISIPAEAKTIAEKYLSPPLTTDFAILFLPTEGLYAEVMRRPGLADELQRTGDGFDEVGLADGGAHGVTPRDRTFSAFPSATSAGRCRQWPWR